MKILYIITQAGGGGAQKYTLTLAKHFGGSIAAGNEASKLFDDAANLQLTTYNLPHLRRDINPYHDFLAIWEIRQMIKILKPNIVHLNSTKAGILGSFAAVGLGVRVVFTAHGFIFNESLSWAVKSFYLALEKIASSYRDFIITVSDADKKSALDNNLIGANKIQTIYNGIQPINFLPKDQARANLGCPDDKIILGAIANFYKTKGLDVLVNAISMLSYEVKNKISVVIIGQGPEFSNIKSLILNFQLSNIVKTLGKIDNASQHLRAFDLFLLPSRKEGFPYTLLEAMQAGLPIIAANVGGNPEAVGNAGILIQPEDPRSLADAITKLLNNPQLQTDLSAKALERSKLFTEQKMLEETKKIYEQLKTP